MRVTYKTLDEFLRDLGNESPDRIFQRAVRVQVCKDVYPPDGVKVGILLQASAVVVTEDGGEYLMEVGEQCGDDWMDATRDFAGSERADVLKTMIEDFCRNRGLTVRPGFFEP